MGKRSLRALELSHSTELPDNGDNDQNGGTMVESPIAKKQRIETTPIKAEHEREKRGIQSRRRRQETNDDLSLIQQGGEAASVENIISQALKSRDRRMLDESLDTSDLLVIRRTIADLPARFVEPLLDQLVSRIRSTPCRMKLLGPWIRELLRQHTGFCMNIPSTRKNLEHLYQHATMRLHHHSDILKLQGQVDQIVYLAQRRNVEKNERQTIEAENPLNKRPLLRFKEGSDLPHYQLQPTTIVLHRSSIQNDIGDTQILEDSHDGHDSFDEFLDAEVN